MNTQQLLISEAHKICISAICCHGANNRSHLIQRYLDLAVYKFGFERASLKAYVLSEMSLCDDKQ